MTWDTGFETTFNPKAIAVVGGDIATAIVGVLQQYGYRGHIYLINPKAAGEERRALKVYPDLVSVGEPPDLVIVCVSAAAVPAVLEDCIAADARNVHIFSAGFEESGEEDGILLGRRIRDIAQRGSLRILGPNCMGLAVPAARMATFAGIPLEPGPVAFISQSGGFAIAFGTVAPIFGIRFSKIISYGNAAGLDSTDFLEYLANDADTRIIAMYVEGVRDGQRFIRLVKEINRSKPIIIWKGGLTESGGRAVASHTGAMAGTDKVWNAFFRQTGAISVDDVEELGDITMTLLYLRPPQGRRVAVLGSGGGHSVAGADVCSRAGLDVPTLTAETRKKLRSLIPPAGTSIRNPLDISAALRDISLLEPFLGLVANDPVVDAIVFALPLDLMGGMSPIMGTQAPLPAGERQEAYTFERESNLLTRFAKEHADKPLVLVLEPRAGALGRHRQRLRSEFLKSGILTYPSLKRACRSLSKLISYHEFQAGYP